MTRSKPKRAAADGRKTDIPAIFGRRLRAAREKAGLTQAVVAYRAELSQNRMSPIEGGRTDLRLSTAHKLARAVGVPLCDLLPK